jgi:hypothetical protein
VQTDRARHEQQAADREVGDLDPSLVTVAQHAGRVPADVEPVPGEHLQDDHNDEKRAGDYAAGQQRPGRPDGRAGRATGRCGDVLGYRSALFIAH